MQKKRILIISYYFAPHNRIGAVRPTKLAKYLTRMGHEVTVICGTGFNGAEDPTLTRDLEELKDLHRIQERSPLRWMLMRKKQNSAAGAASAAKTTSRPETSSVKNMIRQVKDGIYRYLRWLAETDFQHKAIREVRKLSKDFDTVFSCYGPVCVHHVARKAKQIGIAPVWIADFRDELSFPFRWQQWRKKGVLQMITREADIICGVSHGILDVMGLNRQARLLNNGFDREDLPEAKQETHSELRLVYCGQLNMGRKGIPDRDVTPVFQAVRKLVDEGMLSAEDIRIVYAGGEGSLMKRYAATCNLEHCVEDYGWVSRKESIRLQQSADILLLASVHTAKLKGILTGKLFEYLMMDKPIVCCMRGDLTGSGVKKVLQETGMGICCEEAAGAEDEEALLEWLRNRVQAWKTGGDLLQSKNEAAVEAYAYPQLARTLDGWIDELVNK